MTSNCKTCKKVVLFLITVSLLLSGCIKSTALTLSGTIESTQITVSSEVSGKIIKILKEEGSSVSAGEVIAILDSSVQSFNVLQLQQAVDIKRAKLDELKSGTRPQQIMQAEAAVEAAKTSIESAKNSVSAAETSYNYYLDKYNKLVSLQEAGSASESDLKDAKQRLDTADATLFASKQQLASAQSVLKSAQAQFDLLSSGATTQSIEAATSDLAQSQAALDQAKLVASKYQIKSPVDGVFIEKDINIGDIVNAGASIGVVSDIKDLWVKLYITQKYIQMLHLNQQLTFTSKALPNVNLTGEIIYIASEAEFTPKNTETSEAKENTVFQIKLKMINNIDKLKPGMTVDTAINTGGK